MSEFRQVKWVSVKDRLPKTDKAVLVHIHEVESNEDYVDFAYYMSESKEWDFNYQLNPTYKRIEHGHEYYIGIVEGFGIESRIKLEIRAWMDIPSPSDY